MLPQEAAKNKRCTDASSYTFGFYTTKIHSTGETRFTVIFFISAFCSCTTTTRPVCNSSVVLLGESEQLREIGWKVSLVCTFSDSRRSLSLFSFSSPFQPLSAASLADCISDCLTLSPFSLTIVSLPFSFFLPPTNVNNALNQAINLTAVAA